MSGQMLGTIQEFLLIALILVLGIRLLFSMTSPTIIGGILLFLALTVLVPTPVWDKVFFRLEPVITSAGTVIILIVALALILRGFRR